jgi:hypothetical protein
VNDFDVRCHKVRLHHTDLDPDRVIASCWQRSTAREAQKCVVLPPLREASVVPTTRSDTRSTAQRHPCHWPCDLAEWEELPSLDVKLPPVPCATRQRQRRWDQRLPEGRPDGNTTSAVHTLQPHTARHERPCSNRRLADPLELQRL